MVNAYAKQRAREQREKQYYPITLGCSCEVLGLVEDQSPRHICAYHFTFICPRTSHQQAARDKTGLVPNKCVLRVHGPAYAVRWFTPDGEPVLRETRDAIYADRRQRAWELAEPAREAARLEKERKKSEQEAFVLAHGWVKNGEDEWTAPEALRLERRRLRGGSVDRYVKTNLGHAYNTQKLVLDGGPGALPKSASDWD